MGRLENYYVQFNMIGSYGTTEKQWPILKLNHNSFYLTGDFAKRLQLFNDLVHKVVVTVLAALYYRTQWKRCNIGKVIVCVNIDFQPLDIYSGMLQAHSAVVFQ